MKKINDKDRLKKFVEDVAESTGISLGTGGVPGKADESARQKMERLMEDSKKPGAFLQDESFKPADAPAYKELEVPDRDDAAIKKLAEAEANEQKTNELNRIEDETSAKVEELNGKKNALSESKEQSAAKADEYFEAAKVNAGNEALRRGIARSSIILQQFAAIDTDKAKELNEINKAYLKDISDTDGEISALETQRRRAINDLEAATVAKITMKISELTDERDKKIAEAIKYNNILAEKLAEFNLSRQNAEATIKNKNADTEAARFRIESSEEYQNYAKAQRYEYAKDYLMTLGKEAALLELRNNSYYSANLSDYYYKRLESELKAR